MFRCYEDFLEIMFCFKSSISSTSISGSGQINKWKLTEIPPDAGASISLPLSASLSSLSLLCLPSSLYFMASLRQSLKPDLRKVPACQLHKLIGRHLTKLKLSSRQCEKFYINDQLCNYHRVLCYKETKNTPAS